MTAHIVALTHSPSITRDLCALPPPLGTIGVITHAFHLKKQFYPAVVYLNSSGICMMVCVPQQNEFVWFHLFVPHSHYQAAYLWPHYDCVCTWGVYG